MDRSTCHGTIRVKSRYVNYLRCLSGLNTVLSAIRFHTAEEYPRDEDYVCLKVGLEEVSDRSIGDLQVRMLLVYGVEVEGFQWLLY